MLVRKPNTITFANSSPPKDAQYFYSGLYYKVGHMHRVFYWEGSEWKKSSLTFAALKEGHPRHVNMVFKTADTTNLYYKRRQIVEALESDFYKDWTDTAIANLLDVNTSTVRIARASMENQHMQAA